MQMEIPIIAMQFPCSEVLPAVAQLEKAASGTTAAQTEQNVDFRRLGVASSRRLRANSRRCPRSNGNMLQAMITPIPSATSK